MQIVVNGEPVELESADMKVSALLIHLGHKTPQVAVERNGTIVRRALHGETAVVDGDTIEIVTLVGGG